jgi:hypothetical protein
VLSVFFVQTLGHAVVNLALLGGSVFPEHAPAILAGALAPDVPIATLYARERWLRRTPEARIWTECYRRRFWQDFIHAAHSLPLALLGLLMALSLDATAAVAFFGSALLHVLGDFPVHAHDAHRHFFPLSDYRFISPFSYWDVRHHARPVAFGELLLVTAAGATFWFRAPSAATLALAAGIALCYATTYWHSFLRGTRGTQRALDGGPTSFQGRYDEKGETRV